MSDKKHNWLSRLLNRQESEHPEVTQPAKAEGQDAPAQAAMSPLHKSQEQIHAEEQNVPLEWNVGDVILETYEVKEIHEGGGMGVVYRVHPRNWNMDLAVKSPRANFFKTQQQKDNFVRECETWIDLGLHPHIVSCHYVRNLGGIPRVFAEYVEGGTLKDWIDSRKLYEGGPDKALERILDIAIQMAWGLQYAHEKGLIHQDVKPANVLMTEDCTAKVSDFGLAKARVAAGEKYIPGSGRSILVSSGGMTPAYCSPEQANHQSLSHKTDIWSWAVSVLEMFTGEVTWSYGQTAGETLEVFLQTGAEDAAIPRMPEEFIKLLRQCFKRDPEQRPKDMVEVAGDLRDAYHSITGRDYLREQPKPAELLADSLNNQALSMLEIGKLHEATHLWEKALLVQPGHMQATYNMGLFLWRSGQTDDVTLLADLQSLKQTTDSKEKRTTLIARVQLETGDFRGVLETLKNADSQHGYDDTVMLLATAKKGLAQSHNRSYSFPSRLPTAAYLSMDGSLFLVAASDNSVKLWDMLTEQCVCTLQGNTKTVTCIALSGDAKFAMSGSDDKTLRLWDMSTGLCIRNFFGHTSSVISVVLSADTRWALSGCGEPECTIRLWEVSSGRCVRTFEGHESSVNSVSLSAEGKYAFSASSDGTLKSWELATGRCFRTFKGHTRSVKSVAVSLDCKLMISGSSDGLIKLWEVMTGNCLRTFVGHTEPVMSVALNSDGFYGVSGSWDETVRLWNLRTGQCLRTFMIDGTSVEYVCFTDSGNSIFCADSMGMQSIFSVAAHHFSASYEIVMPPVINATKFMDRQYREAIGQARMALERQDWCDAATYVSCARQCKGYSRHPLALEVWNNVYSYLPRKRLVDAWVHRTFGRGGGALKSVALSKNGYKVLSTTVYAPHNIVLWDVDSASCQRTFSDNPSRMCMSVDGKRFFSVEYSGGKLWEVSTGHCVHLMEGHADEITCMDLSQDGRHAVSGSEDAFLKIWDIATGRCVKTLAGHKGRIWAVNISADGRYVVSGSEDKTVRVWDIATGHCVRTLMGHDRLVSAVRSTPDGQYLASSGQDHTLRIWDIAGGRCLRTLQGHACRITDLSADPSGRVTMFGCSDSAVEMWDLSEGRCDNKLDFCAEAGRLEDLSADARFMLSLIGEDRMAIWLLDWELASMSMSDWDEGARPYLENFLTLHTPYVSTDPENSEFLVRRGKPRWNHEDWQGLIRTLQCAGYGWLRPEGVGRELEKMAANWNGPPPLPWEK